MAEDEYIEDVDDTDGSSDHRGQLQGYDCQSKEDEENNITERASKYI